jgi:hemerythrin
MLAWNEKFDTGDELIDAQHRMLISYVNRLEELAAVDVPARDHVELFFRFLEFLESYVLTHFKQEENCMFRTRCPVHFENMRAHTEFLDFFRQFKRQVAVEGWRPEVVRELNEACSAWVQRHILRVDVQLKLARERAPDPNAGAA